MKIKDELILLIAGDISSFDCKSDCPDEVAIYEDGHYGETIRTPTYCNECFAKRIAAIFESWLLRQSRKDASIKFRQTKAYELWQRLNNEFSNKE